MLKSKNFSILKKIYLSATQQIKINYLAFVYSKFYETTIKCYFRFLK